MVREKRTEKAKKKTKRRVNLPFRKVLVGSVQGDWGGNEVLECWIDPRTQES